MSLFTAPKGKPGKNKPFIIPFTHQTSNGSSQVTYMGFSASNNGFSTSIKVPYDGIINPVTFGLYSTDSTNVFEISVEIYNNLGVLLNTFSIYSTNFIINTLVENTYTTPISVSKDNFFRLKLDTTPATCKVFGSVVITPS